MSELVNGLIGAWRKLTGGSSDNREVTIPVQQDNLREVPAVKYDNRVLVLGSYTVGSSSLQDGLEKLIRERGLTSTKVEALRDSGQINFAFSGGPDNLPLKAVVLLPQMRDYQSGGYSFNPFETGFDRRIIEMCGQRNVPLIQIRNGFDEKRSNKELEKLLPGE